MDTAISLKDAGLILIGAGLIVLIAYCIAFMKNLVVTVKRTNKILEDTQVITKLAADKSKEIDKAISGVTSSIGNLSEALKGNQSKIAAFSSIINALTSLKNLVKNG